MHLKIADYSEAMKLINHSPEPGVSNPRPLKTAL
jgi:hypothetical protein